MGSQDPVPCRCRRTGPGRGSLAWATVFFLGGQLGLALVLEYGRPGVRDPEYARRLTSLRACRDRLPGSPLVLALGSSRVAMGIRPESPDRPGRESEPLLFNYGLVGAGPVLQLLCLHRLLEDGIRPDLVLVEYWPPFLDQEGSRAEETRFDPLRLGGRDLILAGRYFRPGQRLYSRWWAAQLFPEFSYRLILFNQLLPAWLPWRERQDTRWGTLDASGWLSPRAGPPGNTRRCWPTCAGTMSPS